MTPLAHGWALMALINGCPIFKSILRHYILKYQYAGILLRITVDLKIWLMIILQGGLTRMTNYVTEKIRFILK